MKEEFEKFCENLKLTRTQSEDARQKYEGVAKKLLSTRAWFGSKSQ